MIVGDFNILVSITDRTTREKSSKHIEDLTLDPTDNYKTLHPGTAEQTFFSNTHGTFSRIDFMIDYKTNFNKFKRFESYNVCSLTIMQLHNKSTTEENFRNYQILGNLNNNNSK